MFPHDGCIFARNAKEKVLPSCQCIIAGGMWYQFVTGDVNFVIW